MNRSADTCVVHLVREKNGVEPFRNFLESYVSFAAGIDHDLLVIFKGFGGRSATGDFGELLKDIPHKAFFVSDAGFDISPYRAAARTFDYRYFCYLNSFSVIQGEDWLLKLHEHARKKETGLVGATGSYESSYTHFLDLANKMPAWRRVLTLPSLRMMKLYFDPFPNCHIRTNAFMISRNAMNEVSYGIVRTKLDAQRFESGKNGLTKQIMGRGLEALVVGRNGVGYRTSQWKNSATFRQGNQENLLIADNQTRSYMEADEETRNTLSRLAWGSGPQ